MKERIIILRAMPSVPEDVGDVFGLPMSVLRPCLLCGLRKGRFRQPRFAVDDCRCCRAKDRSLPCLYGSGYGRRKDWRDRGARITPAENNNARRPGEVGGRLVVLRRARQRIPHSPQSTMLRRCTDFIIADTVQKRKALPWDSCLVGGRVHDSATASRQFDFSQPLPWSGQITRWSGNHFIWGVRRGPACYQLNRLQVWKAS